MSEFRPFVGERTEQILIDDLPPFLTRSWDVQGAVDVLVAELERVQDATTNIRNNFWPHLGTDYLHIFEEMLDLSVDPPDKSTAQRQNSVLAFYRKLKASGTGLDWQETISALIGTGWTYLEHDPDDAGTPDAYVLELTIPFTAPIDVPSGFAAVAGGGGTLAAGTYYYAVSAANFYGETQPSVIDDATIGAPGAIDLDWNDVADADSYRIYRGTSPTNLRRLDLGMELTTSDYEDDGTATVTNLVSTNTNTTGSFQSREARALARKITPANIQLDFGFDAGFILGDSELGDFL